MPASLPSIPGLNRFSLLFLFLFLPLFFWGQSLSGLWTGVMTNDSVSVRKDQSFEIALTEYRGKVYGYSRSEFIVDDTLYYIVKRVKGTIDGDVCEVKDDEIISCNFQKRLDKGVKVTSIFLRNKQDSSWYLAGKWKTNQTKNYYTISGKVALQEEKDLTKSKLFPHLEELDIANDVAFYKNRQTQPVVLNNAIPDNQRFETLIRNEEQRLLNGTAVISTIPNANAVDVTVIPVSPTQPIYINTEPVQNNSVGIPIKTDVNIAKAELKQDAERLKTNIKPQEENTIDKPGNISDQPDTKTVATKTITVTPAQVLRTTTEPLKTNTSTIPVKTDVNIAKAELKQDPKKQATVVNNQPQTLVKNPPVTSSKPDAKKVTTTTVPITSTTIVRTQTEPKKTESLGIPLKTETNTPSPLMPEPRKTVDMTDLVTALTAGRKSEYSQVVNFSSDSLELALYDNGEIDGDTVSVYMNGQIILSQQGLKATAIKKTIYITPGNEEFTLVLYADNLGKYPPNTGLLVVHDGEDVYNIRFSADLQKNAGVVFRKKR
jgi:hypothetical protein